MQKSSKSRRQVLKAALVGAAGLAGMGALDKLDAAPSAAGAKGGAKPTGNTSGMTVTQAVIQSLNGEWQIAADPQDIGRSQKWSSGPVPGAKPTPVPWIIANIFPDYHGVAWYWRTFAAPINANAHGRTLLRFQSVDYTAEVWVNGVPVGKHEGAEGSFTLDATHAVHRGPNAQNQLAVRVLNPTEHPIDGMTRDNTPHRNKTPNIQAGSLTNYGGILGSVEVIAAPPARIDDLWARANPATGRIRLAGSVHNALGKVANGTLEITIAPAMQGETLLTHTQPIALADGQTEWSADLTLANPRLWDLDDPFLYQATARLHASAGEVSSTDEASTRFGFREFRCERGYFRLNGRRLFLRCTHTGNQLPISQTITTSEYLRRDLMTLKTMGFNAVRFFAGGLTEQQADLCDEIGLMAYAESYGVCPFADGPDYKARYDHTLSEMIREHRSHPSVTMFGLMNETFDGPQFRHAVEALSIVRGLDDSRLVMLSSGRWDMDPTVGSVSNPGSNTWEYELGNDDPHGAKSHTTPYLAEIAGMGDRHFYPYVPQRPDATRDLRIMGEGTKNVFLSEYGIGTGVNLWRLTRFFEQMGAPDVEDARFYRQRLDQFLADWDKWNMADVFPDPDGFFQASLARGARQRTLGLNAIRSNPHINGHSLTGAIDHGNCGEGLITLFRELKPGTIDALSEGFAPLRLCLFAEPMNAYRGNSFHLEAVLANEDALKPGQYPLQLQVIGPDNQRAFSRTITVTVPDGPEPPFALPLFAEDIPIDGPAGTYRFLAGFERGAAPTGGEATFYLGDRATLPAVNTPVTLWGDDPALAAWLTKRNIAFHPFSETAPAHREVILCGNVPFGKGGAPAFGSLARRIGGGSSAIFLSPEIFADGGNSTRWLPLANKGIVQNAPGWLYQNDDWGRAHPVFAGLPAGGLLDYGVYREILGSLCYTGQDKPAEAIAGRNQVALNYNSGLLLATYPLGAGRFYLNTLALRENLAPGHPVAERLLTNLLNDAARGTDTSPAALPANFADQLHALGLGT